MNKQDRTECECRRWLNPACHFVFAISIFLFLVLGLTVQRGESQEVQTSEWRSQKSGVLARLTALFFVDETHGWVGGSNGILMSTEDGGEVWKRITLPEPQRRETIRDLWIFDAGRALVLGEYGMFSRRAPLGFVERIFVLSTADSGQTWSESNPGRPPVTETPARIIKNNEQEIAIEPSKMKRPPDPVLLRMRFADQLLGWACGEGGTIQTTKDGGQTWAMHQISSRKLLYDLAVIDKQTIWVVGAGGTLLKTEDGGQNWLERRSGTGETIRAIEFTDFRSGWIAGDDGAILATADGGNSWRKQNVPTTQPLNDIHFMGAEGWAIGNNGTMLHTLDGGTTWKDESFDTHANLSRIHFVAPGTGWIVGSNGVIFKFTRKQKIEE